MYTAKELKEQLAGMGVNGTETILIHSSMKAIGAVEGGAETVLDVIVAYFKDGLVLFPTHTWSTINEQNPVYNPAKEPSCVGLLTNLFLKRNGVVRSLHPTHSLAGIGENAADYLTGEENCNTPCTPGGCYDRLRECDGKILLIGVGHARNTFIHSVEEVLNVPNRLADMPMKLEIVMPDGGRKTVYMRKHYNSQQPHISEDFVKLNQAFLDCKAVREVTFGNAACLLCDAKRIFEVVRHVLAPNPQCLVTEPAIDCARWSELRGV